MYIQSFHDVCKREHPEILTFVWVSTWKCTLEVEKLNLFSFLFAFLLYGLILEDDVNASD